LRVRAARAPTSRGRSPDPSRRLAQEFDRARGISLRHSLQEETSLQVEAVRLGIVGAPGGCHLHFLFSRGARARTEVLAEERRAKLRHHRLRDVVLHREDVVELAIVGLRPEMRVVRHVDELAVMRTRFPLLRTLPSRIVDTLSFCATVPMSIVLPLKKKAGRARGDAKPRIFASTLRSSSERPSAKYSFSSSAAHVDEGEHRDRWRLARGALSPSVEPRSGLRALRRPSRGETPARRRLAAFPRRRGATTAPRGTDRARAPWPRGVVDGDRHQERLVFGHEVRPVTASFRLEAEIALGARVGVRRDHRHEERAFLDLLADRGVPRVAAAQLVLVEPHFEPGRLQRHRTSGERRRRPATCS
jgi:hypothetical protein